MRMKLKQTILIIKNSFYHWQSHRATRMGAALSYYAIFSIIPFLMLIVIVIGPSLGSGYIQTEIIGQVREVISVKSAAFIQAIFLGLSEIQFNFFTILIAIGSFIVGTLGVFYELKNSLDDLWDSAQTKREARSWKYFLSSRLLSLSMIPILCFLLIISLVFSALISFVSGYSQIFASMTYLLQFGTFVFSFFVMCFLFTFIYRFLPKRKLPWKELVRGALITSILFMIGKFIIGVYITDLAGASIFGTAESFIVLLLWTYYSVQIFLFGASMTYVYSKQYGHLKNS